VTDVSSLRVARFMRLSRRTSDTWQGGLLRLPMWVDGEGAGEPPYRPWGGAWMSLETGLANVKAGAAADPALALEALIDLGLRFAHTRPARLEVMDPALGDAIVRGLGDPELTVTLSRDLASVREMVRQMGEHAAETSPPAPALAAPGVTLARMRAFAGAARDFYAAAPWRHLSDGDLIHIEAPSVAPPFRCVTVLGAGGETFGLGFFASSEEFDRATDEPDPRRFLGGRGRWSVLYGPPWETPFSDLDLWEEHGLALADGVAYPLALWFGPSGGTRRPDAKELADLETVLAALARTTEAEIDQGRWSHEVTTPDGPRQVTLAIPELLAPIDATPAAGPRALRDRRATERVLLEIERFTSTREFASEAELNAQIHERFSGVLDGIPSTATTPLERAQDLAYRAFEARGRRRLQLARRALELSPDCADAYVVLAEQSADAERARELYAGGVAAGERALGLAAFAESAGRFWGLVATRPYMRARLGLAQSLEALGRPEEALLHYRELLRLNPSDNQGARYLLLVALLRAGRDEEAGTLLGEFPDEPTALWGYGRALWLFRREGDSAAAREALRDAHRTNRHVPAFLTEDTTWDGPQPDEYAFGSREEAVLCADDLGEAWEGTAGALPWLRAHGRPARRKRRRR